MLAKQVSPPRSGSCTARRIDPIGGSARNVLSLCHSSAPSPTGWIWSSTTISGASWCTVCNGDTCIGPNRSANASCWSSSMSWSRKKSTRWSSSAPRRHATSSSVSDWLRSIPLTAAPMASVRGRISMLVPMDGTSPPGYPLAAKNLRQGEIAMVDGAGPRFSRLEDVPWEEVRKLDFGDRTASVREKWLDFSPRFLSLLAEWDPGMMIHAHGHNSDHIVYVLRGTVHCGDVECGPGTHIALDQGDTFGPFVAGS